MSPIAATRAAVLALAPAAVIVLGSDRREGHLRLEGLLGERLLAGQLDLAHRIDGDDLDRHLVAFLDDVRGLPDAVGRELRDVHEAVLARQDLDEAP